MLNNKTRSLQYVGNFSSMERFAAKYGGAAAMYMISKRLKKRHNITDERAALYDAAEHWVKALNGRSFMGMWWLFPLGVSYGSTRL